MNKTEKVIVAFLLANFALAGALHYFSPSKPAVDDLTSTEEPITANSQTEINPTVEVSVYETNTSGPIGDLHNWVARDPYAAVNWAKEHPVNEKRDAVLVAACYEIANANPAEAVNLAEKYALTNQATLADLAQQWAGQDLGAAYAWVLAKPTGEERDQLVARVGYVWSATEPAKAADFVVREIPQGPAQTEAAISILHQWALRNFDDAAAWVELFPESDIRQRALNELSGVRNYSLSGNSSRTR